MLKKIGSYIIMGLQIFFIPIAFFTIFYIIESWNKPTLDAIDEIEQRVRAKFPSISMHFAKIDECRKKDLAPKSSLEETCTHRQRMTATSERELSELIAYDVELKKQIVAADLRFKL